LTEIELQEGLKFCPRCGLAIESVDQHSAAFKLNANGTEVFVEDRFAFGDVANLYRCTIASSGANCLLKISRTPEANRHLANEAAVLNRLHASDKSGRLAPFLPKVVACISYSHAGQPAQSANLLGYHGEISSPDELFSLQEVRDAYPNGIDARDMAWMWRRLLTVLGYLGEARIVHTAVCPDHILIEPREHKLVLVGWCAAVEIGRIPALMPSRWRDWINNPGTASEFGNDVAFAAKSMSFLVGTNVDAGIARHLARAGESNVSPMRLLEDFDRLIEALWGPKRFREFSMPARRQ
jgi:hypothetical protein